MRRFHGLLIAALPAPLGRALLLHALHEVVELDGGPVQSLQSGRDGDPPAVPRVDFCLKAGLPQWTFVLADDVRVERSVVVPHGQNTVHVRYRLIGATGPALLRIRPWLDFRPHEGLVTPQQHLHYEVAQISATRCEFTRTESPLRLRMQVIGEHAAFAAEPREWSPIELTIERDRGYDHMTSAHGPGAFTLMLAPGTDAFITATTEPWEHLDGVTAGPGVGARADPAPAAALVERREPAAARHVPAGAGRGSVHRAAGDPRGRRRGGLRRRRRAAHGDRRLPLVHRLGPRHDDQPGRADPRHRPPLRGARHPADVRAARAARPDPEHVPGRPARGAVPHRRRDALVLPRAAPLRHPHRRPRARRGAAAGAAGHRALPSPGHRVQHPRGRRRAARAGGARRPAHVDGRPRRRLGGDAAPRQGRRDQRALAQRAGAARRLAAIEPGSMRSATICGRKRTAAAAPSTHGSGTRRRGA